MRTTTFAFLLMFVAAQAPAGDPIEIQKPLGGSTVTEEPFEAAIDDRIDPSSIDVTVNGTPLPASAYSVAAGRLTGAMDPSLLVGGVFNSLEITGRIRSGGPAHAASSSFLWFAIVGGETGEPGSESGGGFDAGALLDTLGELLPTIGKRGPELTIDSPSMGDFVPIGGPVTVAGTVVDAAGLVDLAVAIDGRPPESQLARRDPNTGRFAFDVVLPLVGLHRILVIATNVDGGRSVEKISVFAGEAKSPGDRIVNASQFLVTDHGIHQVGNMIEPALTPAHLFKKVVSGQSIWKGKAGLSKGEMWLTALGHEGIDLQLGFENGLLRLRAYVTRLQARSRLEAKYLFVKTTANPVLVSQMSIWDAWVRIEKASGQGVRLVLQQDTVQLQGLEGEIPGLPDALTDAAIGALEGFLQQTLQDSLGTHVLKSLEGTLNRYFLVVTGPHTSEVLGAEVKIGGELTNIRVAGNVGRFHTDSTVVALDPEFEPEQDGWLSTPANPERPLVPTKDMTLAVSDDILNAALYEVWRSGAFNFDLTALLSGAGDSGFTLGSLGEELKEETEEAGGGIDLAAILSLASDLPIGIEMRPMLSPVFRVGYDGDDLLLQAHEVFIDFYLELEETRQLLFSVVVDLELPLNDWVLDDQRRILEIQLGELDLGLELRDLLRIDFRIDRMPLLSVPYGPFTNLVTQVAHLALPFLLEIINDSALDSLGNLPLVNVEVWGEPDNLILTGELVADNADNGGTPLYADGFSEKDTEEKLAFKFCGLVALFGGTSGDFLLDVYRRFRDDVLDRLPGGDEGIDAYYSHSILVYAAVEAVPAARPLAVAAFWAVGILLLLALYTDGAFAAWCVLVALFLARRRLARGLSRLLALRAPAGVRSSCCAWAHA